VSAAVIAERLTSQLLAGPPARDPVSVVERLLAVQGQDPRGHRLAIRARSSGLSAADVDRALTEDRSLVLTTLNRGTLHLVRSEDYPWLQALTAPGLLPTVTRRVAREGVSARAAERALAAIEGSLAAEGPLTRGQLRERIRAAGAPVEGQALVHLIMLASLRGLIVRGPMIGREQGFVLVREWLGEPAPVDRGQALAELARRYLAGHAPAGERDLARWSGLGLREVRAGLAAIAPELGSRADGLLALAGHPPAAELPPPRLLGPFDPLLHGWISREAILGAHRVVVTVNGLFRPFALVRGRAVATWRMPAGEVVLEPFRTLPRRDAEALRADAVDVVRYLGSTSEKVKPS
jgi:Winged helix DNA-binding domain